MIRRKESAEAETFDHRADQPKVSLWPLWICVALAVVFFGGMTLDGRGGPVAAFLLMCLMVIGWGTAVAALVIGLYSLVKLRVGAMLLAFVLAGLLVIVNLLVVMPLLKLASGQ